MFIIINHYTNEDISEFDRIAVMEQGYSEQAAAVAAADAMLATDIEEGIERETVPTELDDILALDESWNCPVHIAGVMTPDGYEHYHNIYMVFEVKPAEAKENAV